LDSTQRPYSLKLRDQFYSDYLQNFVIQGHYLYVMTSQHSLIIYDITDAPNPKKLSEVTWDWIDTLKEDRYYSRASKFIIKNNRAIVIYERGFLVFDISDPAHPKQIGKM